MDRTEGGVGQQAIGSPQFKPQNWSGARKTAVEKGALFQSFPPPRPPKNKKNRRRKSQDSPPLFTFHQY